MRPRKILLGFVALIVLGGLGFLLGWGAEIDAAMPGAQTRDGGEPWSYVQGYNPQLEPPQSWDGTVDGFKTLWYPNGVKYGEGLFRDNVKEGPWTFWHENGVKRWEGVYFGGKPSGAEHAWYDSGRPHYEGAFEDERRHGPFTYWYENGEKWWQGEFVRGQREGRFEQWNEDGSLNLALSGEYDSNRRVAELADVPANQRVSRR